MAETRTAPAKAGAKEDVVVQGRALADNNQGSINVTYHPGAGDPEETEVFGQKVKAGKSVEIPAKYAEKVRGNPYLAVGKEKPFAAAAEREDVEEQEVATFDENLARERSEEYLSGRPVFANTSPAEQERVARAMEQAAELKQAVESDDKDKPKRRKD